jgi:hypothetical protein
MDYLSMRRKTDWYKDWDTVRPEGWKEMILWWRDVKGIEQRIIDDINYKIELSLGTGLPVELIIKEVLKSEYKSQKFSEFRKPIDLELQDLGLTF